MKKKFFRKYKLKKASLVAIIIISLIIFICLSFNIINKKVSPILISVAEVEINKLASIIVGKTLNEEIIKKINTENLFIVEKDETGKIQMIDYNSTLVNEILLDSLVTLRTNLKYLSDGELDKMTSGNTLQELYSKYDINKLNKGIFYEIPMGVCFGNPFLANLGPKIPVKFKLIGDLSNKLDTEIRSFGINNAILETFLELKVTFSIILPIVSKQEEVEFRVPISIKVIQNEIPEYYFNGGGQNSSIFTLPVE